MASATEAALACARATACFKSLSLKSRYFIGIKAEYVTIADTIGDAVAVQLVAEYGTGGVAVFFIFFLDRRARKTKKQGAWKSAFNNNQHVLDCLECI